MINLNSDVIDVFGNAVAGTNVRDALLKCCLDPIPSDGKLPVEARIALGDLAKIIHDTPCELELDSQQIAVLRERAGMIFQSNAMVWGVCKILKGD
jgi:ABC-type histidine transport system ATPase subunit